MELKSTKEVTMGEDAKSKLLLGIEKLAEAVLVTMGPMGRTVIISDEYGRPYITKDGVSVANAIKLKDPIENIAAKLIKEVAQKTADEAGDGTTTSICLAQSFIRNGLEILQQETTITELQKAIDKLVADTLEHLKANAQGLAITDVYKVAKISANNDETIANLIQKAYSASTSVKVEEGKSHEDKIEVVNGMIHNVSYMSHNFVNNEKRKEASFENPKVIVVGETVGSLDPYTSTIQYMASNNESLVMFVEDMAEAPLRKLETLALNKQLNVAVVKAPGFGQYRKDHLKDIASFTGCTPTMSSKGRSTAVSLGTAKHIVISKLNTIISKDDRVDVTDLIKDLKEQSKEAKVSDYDRTFIFDRIDNLTGSLSVITVGGSSELEMRERKDRIEDAVLAVKSALEEGIVEGGGVALLRAYNKIIDTYPKDTLLQTLAHALLAPSYQIFMNSGGTINEDTSEDRFKLDIIDPLKVTRCALENAASVAKTILSTEAVVLNESLWN